MESLSSLREELRARNGIAGLELLQPHETQRACDLLYRDGFVVVRDVLNGAQLQTLRSAVDREVAQILNLDPECHGNRGARRYSFGSASRTGHMLHHPEWAMLLDLPNLTPILTSIFDSSDYIARGGGGDFCLAGAQHYQPLHADAGDRKKFTVGNKRVSFGSFHDPRGRLSFRDLPLPYLACNFLVQDFTALNGPTRQIPGTQHSHAAIPKLADEPTWMKYSTVCPAPAGSVLLRDVRAWHGGTPNLSQSLRAIPNIEILAPWFHEPLQPCIPKSLHETLSDHARHITRYLVAPDELETGYHEDLGGTPGLLKTPINN